MATSAGAPGGSAPLLSGRGLTRSFDGVAALRSVDFELRPGEVLAVVGENGAGKSTLMKIVAGVLAPDTGTLAIDGRPVAFPGVAAARAAGIALIPQERTLVDCLDVAGNVLLGREPRRCGLVDRRALRRAAAASLAAVGLDVDPGLSAARLSPGQQQLVEIAAALSADARVLVMDEPTSSLSATESARLLGLVAGLRARGAAVLYCSHRLGEIEAVADRALVLRDGELAGVLRRDEISHDRLLRLMLGRDLVRRQRRPRQLAPADGRRDGAAPDGAPSGGARVVSAPGASSTPPALAVRGLRTAEHPAVALDVSVAAGEIVGLAGLVGAGRSELLAALAGVTPPRAGEVRLLGRLLPTGGPRARLLAGFGYLPEDRQREGLLLELSLRENVGLSMLGREARAGFVDRRAERLRAARARDELTIRAPSLETPVASLSGGNQQKVVLARVLATRPAVLLLDEPTRGVDVAAKDEIHRLVEAAADAGAAVLFASSEMEELLALADRVLVLRAGRIVGELSGERLTERAIGALATGAVVAA